MGSHDTGTLLPGMNTRSPLCGLGLRLSFLGRCDSHGCWDGNYGLDFDKPHQANTVSCEGGLLDWWR